MQGQFAGTEVGRCCSTVDEGAFQRAGDEKREMGVVAQGITKAALMMTIKYHLVLTNVPYLTRGKQNEELKEFCEKQYSAAKNDLATVFLDRCLEFCSEGGTANVVLPQNWLFLTSYRKFRERLLKENAWHMIGRLGFAAFEIMDWWAFNTTLISIGRRKKDNIGNLIASQGSISGVDASETRQLAEKSALLRTAEIKQVEQERQLENPDARIALENLGEVELLGKYSQAYIGQRTGDGSRFIFYYWEKTLISNRWTFSGYYCRQIIQLFWQ